MDSAEDGREQILRAATRLFAALGYDSSSIEQIAEAAGVSQEEVNARFAGKRQLYLTVMDQARTLSEEIVHDRADLLLAAPPERRAEALRDFVDGYIDLCVSHPEIPALWMHRWLSDASDIADLEATSAQPLLRHCVESLSPLADPAGADALHIVYTLVWCAHGFVLSGVLTGDGLRRGIDDEEQVRLFRAHMRQLLGRALNLPDLPRT